MQKLRKRLNLKYCSIWLSFFLNNSDAFLLIENSFFIDQKYVDTNNNTTIQSSTTITTEKNKTEREENNLLIPYLEIIITTIAKAFTIYGIKSSMLLIDVISTLFDTIQKKLKNSALTQLFLPSLVQNFFEVDDNDTRFFYVFLCKLLYMYFI